MKNPLKLILSITIPVGTGLLAGLLTSTGESSWYQTINKPSWNPPSWIFGPVWTTLYVLMGIALFLVWKHPAPVRKKRPAFWLFGIQLLLNFAWSFIFFTFQSPAGALAEIIVLWVFILLTIFSFSKYSRAASWLLVPYISWVSFATILTWTIWKLNN